MNPVAIPRKQVITIHPDGGMSGLQVKPGRGVDLRQFGKAQIERVSEISWDVELQRWYVHLFNCLPLTSGLLETVTGVRVPDTATVADDGRLLFVDYDAAVEVEIFYLDGIRLYDCGGNEKRPEGIGTSPPAAAAGAMQSRK